MSKHPRLAVGTLVVLVSALAAASPPRAPRLSGILIGSTVIVPGKKTVFASQSPSSETAVLFMASEIAAFFYAIDLSRPEQPIVDALHIYSVADFEGDEEWELKILWSRDGNTAALLLDDYPHAVFDFVKKRGFCRTGLPRSHLYWTAQAHTWDDAALAPFHDRIKQTNR